MTRVLLEWRHRVAGRLGSASPDRGAGFVEYAGLLLLIAAVVVTVFGLGLDNQIATAVQRAVSSVLNL
ncbi:hypothetical protein GCM10027160_52760 [Streptomyces calidiresistens]